jgi:tetratricopeptide (TPR) repeat protein
MGHVLYYLECYYEALTAFRRAVQLDPSDAWAHYGQGNILRDIGCEKDAFLSYSRAARLDPLCEPAHHWREQMRLYLIKGKDWRPVATR